MKPRVFDAFPFAGTPTELLLLECRLVELYDVVDAFIIVEADVNHQDVPKPYNFLDNEERYAKWRDKIAYVQATNLPKIPEGQVHQQDPWAREHAQREWIRPGLDAVNAADDDILLQSDADEIPRPFAVRNCLPYKKEVVAFGQRGHFWAIDWLYPKGWNGTVAARVGAVESFGVGRKCGPFTAMRDKRNSSPVTLPDAGWHFSWLGDHEAWMRKVNSFCHPEVEDRIKEYAGRYFNEGIHVDGEIMKPVNVDQSWPKWMQDPENVPKTWLRPR